MKRFAISRVAEDAYVVSLECPDGLTKSVAMTKTEAYKLRPDELERVPMKRCAAFSIGGMDVLSLRIEDDGAFHLVDNRKLEYPDDRCGDWIPIRAKLLANGQRFMVHPEHQCQYGARSYHNGILTAQKLIAGGEFAIEHIPGENWVWVECR